MRFDRYSPFLAAPARTLLMTALVGATSALLLLSRHGSAAAAAPPTTPPAHAAPADKAARERVALKGEIVDLGCYLMHEGRGDTHVACAQACVKGGAPVGLLAGGALYVLFAPHETTAPFEEAKRLVGKSVTVTGVVHDRGGLRGLAVTLVAARP